VEADSIVSIFTPLIYFGANATTDKRHFYHLYRDDGLKHGEEKQVIQIFHKLLACQSIKIYIFFKSVRTKRL